MEKKSTYNYDAQKKYNAKTKMVSIKFMPNEMDFFNQIETTCDSLGMSKQMFIKTAIREKLGNMQK